MTSSTRRTAAALAVLFVLGGAAWILVREEPAKTDEPPVGALLTAEVDNSLLKELKLSDAVEPAGGYFPGRENDSWVLHIDVSDGDPLVAFDQVAAHLAALGVPMAGSQDACSWFVKVGGSIVMRPLDPTPDDIRRLECTSEARGELPSGAWIDVAAIVKASSDERTFALSIRAAEGGSLELSADPPEGLRGVERAGRASKAAVPTLSTQPPTGDLGAGCLATVDGRLRLPEGATLTANGGDLRLWFVIETADARGAVADLAQQIEDGHVASPAIETQDIGGIEVYAFRKEFGDGVCAAQSDLSGRFVLLELEA
jgi:hypothetical protein